MQLHTENNVLQTNLKTQAHVFQIHASAKAFKILSSNLYRYKVAAVIRELSCNALDSHVDAGNKDPFIIHLPTQIEPFFAIEDFGTGMTPDQIGELYTGYFASSKTDRNDQIGALGLGSKSPFAYTDMFTIDSVKDGLKSTYSAFLDPAGMPTYMLVMSETSDQHSGVRVTFPVPESDFREFALEAATIFWAFNPDQRPTIVGAVKSFKDQTSDYDTATTTYEGAGWKIYRKYPNCIDRKYNWSNGAMVRMGNILYPINSLASDSKFADVEAYLKNPLIIDMPLGSCDINPSREELSYDDLTKENIHEALVEIHKNLEIQASAQINTATTIWNAAIEAKKYFSTILRDRNDSKIKFTYKGIEYLYGQTITLAKSAHVSHYMTSSRSSSGNTIKVKGFSDKVEVALGKPNLLVITGDKNPDNQYIRGRIKMYCLQKKLPETAIWVVDNLSAADDATLCQMPNVLFTELPKTQQQQKKQASKGKVIKWDNHSEVDIAALTDKIKIYIVDYKKQLSINGKIDDGAKLYSNKKGRDRVSDIIRTATTDRLLPASIRNKIYIIPAKLFTQLNIAKSKGWVSLESILITGMNHLSKKHNSLAQDASTLTDLLEFYTRVFEYAPEFYNKGLSQNSPFIMALEALKVLKANVSKSEKETRQAANIMYHVREVISHANLTIAGVNSSKAVFTDTLRIFENYPLLHSYLGNATRWDSVDLKKTTLKVSLGHDRNKIDTTHGVAIKDIVDYVKMVDSSSGIV